MGVHVNKRAFDQVALTPDAFYAAQQAAADAQAAALAASAHSSVNPPPQASAVPAARQHEMRTRHSNGAAGSSADSDADSVCSSWSTDDERRIAADAREGGRRTKRRRKWGKTEDRLLRQVVAELQAPGLAAGADPKISWSAVAKRIPTRSAKQCRDRWNSITPGIKKREWTKEEDDLLLRLYRTHKNSWVRIAKEFEGRNDNMLKSRFRSLCKRKRVKEMLALPPHHLEPSPLAPHHHHQQPQQQQQYHEQHNPAPVALPRLPSTSVEDDIDSFLASCGTMGCGNGAPPQLFRGTSLGFLQRKSSLPPAPGQLSVRGTSGLFANLTFAEPAPQLPPAQLAHGTASSDGFSVGSSGADSGSPAPLLMDDELADWCAVMVDEHVL